MLEAWVLGLLRVRWQKGNATPRVAGDCQHEDHVDAGESEIHIMPGPVFGEPSMSKIPLILPRPIFGARHPLLPFLH